MKITRREFIISGAACLGAAALWKFSHLNFNSNIIPGEIVGASSALGHKLRAGHFPDVSSTVEKDIVVIGGGIAGLAAAYALAKAGQKNFTLLDLEKRVGGNAASGENAISQYPWGAHYVSLVTEEATAVRGLFEELGIITGYDPDGLPIYNEYYICADPQERLYMYGRWQDGLVPTIGLTIEEEIQYKRFFSIMEKLKNQKGKDGKRLFAIPLDKSSEDEDWVALDKITMSEWLVKEGFTSKPLKWYVNYCCRDDFGTAAEETSAWAGIHYFASRNGLAANVESSNVITWPEGNGWIANKLAAPIKDNIITKALTYNIKDHGDHVSVDYWDESSQQSRRINAKAAVVATPRFIASRIVKSDKISLSADAFSYSPWIVANITLGTLPRGKGASLSWDNVVYNSQLLGYVVATHQITQMTQVKTVITYYWPLSHLNPTDARNEAFGRSYNEWQKIILKELLQIHPELEGYIERMDLCIWGHAMVRPTRDFIWGEARKNALKQHAPIFTAHSDMSGISTFEEAYTHGVRAAENVMSYLNMHHRSVL